MFRILIIDKEVISRQALSAHFAQNDYDVKTVESLGQSFDCTMVFEPDVVISELILPDGNILENLHKIRSAQSLPEVIIFTEYADADQAELAIRKGIWSYIVKGSGLDLLTGAVDTAIQYRCEKKDCPPLYQLHTKGIIGTSPKITTCLDSLAKAAQTDVNVLLYGETGTGKELFARALHDNSPRRQGAFVVVDCATLPPALVEGILFGHAKGTFTGADADRSGLIKQADGGTLFLDEIGELPLPMQKAFLRVLQDHTFRPVGGEREIHSDFRLVAATNRDLDRLVQENCFRNDLLYRLKGITLKLPALRERKRDIPELVTHHLQHISLQNHIPPKHIDPRFIEYLMEYPWPGNIRELVHTLQSALIAAYNHTTLFPRHLPEEIRVYISRYRVAKHPPKKAERHSSSHPRIMPIRDVRTTAADAAEEHYLIDLLAHVNGNVMEACTLAGLSKSRFYTLLRKYNINIRS